MDKNCKPMREKYWKELDSEKKIERLRKEIKALLQAKQNFQQLIEKLRKHKHTKDTQEIVIPFEGGEHFFNLGGMFIDKDEVYI